MTDSEVFIEYGVRYEKSGNVPRSSWKTDPLDVAKDRLMRERVHGGTDMGPMSIVKRTTTYLTTDWEPIPLDEIDRLAEEVRQSAPVPTEEQP